MVDGWMEGWLDGWTGDWIDGWMNGWMDGWKEDPPYRKLLLRIPNLVVNLTKHNKLNS